MRNFTVDSHDLSRRRDFRGEATSLATATGEMHYTEADGLDLFLTTHAVQNLICDELCLILMLQGQVQCEYKGADAKILKSGDFFLVDGTRETTLHFSRHSFIQLDLPRPLLQSLFSGPAPSPAFINTALARSRLAPLLRDHLRRFPQQVTTMAPHEQAAWLNASESFALAAIEAACATLRGAAEPFGSGLITAAQRYIRRHLADPDLCPEAVAAALGCSRATLYRLFADHQWTVQGYVRELRLQAFVHLLQTEDRAIHIRVLAERCGLYDYSNLSRLFRRRFGMTPAEARSLSTHHRTT